MGKCNGAILELGFGHKAMIGVCLDYESSRGNEDGDDGDEENGDEILQTHEQKERDPLQSPIPSFSQDASLGGWKNGPGRLTRRRVMIENVLNDSTQDSAKD